MNFTTPIPTFTPVCTLLYVFYVKQLYSMHYLTHGIALPSMYIYNRSPSEKVISNADKCCCPFYTGRERRFRYGCITLCMWV